MKKVNNINTKKYFIATRNTYNINKVIKFFIDDIFTVSIHKNNKENIVTFTLRSDANVYSLGYNNNTFISFNNGKQVELTSDTVNDFIEKIHKLMKL